MTGSQAHFATRAKNKLVFRHLDSARAVQGLLWNVAQRGMKTQVWIAISVYVLAAIVRKHLVIERDLYTIQQILGVSLKKTPRDPD